MKKVTYLYTLEHSLAKSKEQIGEMKGDEWQEGVFFPFALFSLLFEEGIFVKLHTFRDIVMKQCIEVAL